MPRSAITPDQLRTMAAAGMSRIAIATQLGCTKKTVDNALFRLGIKTRAHKGPAPNPEKYIVPHGCGGEKPPKLMPSADALRMVSVFGIAHA